ncbi:MULTISPECIES: hypothetical protein [Campylobacter]|uniref:hypothetical protein n=1 Tax=Campylobacter TaxID=194 RepID=UPI000A34D71F|nr:MULTISPECIES: hypothetical protein [unclassified Campylobacter]MCR8678885.1 hypothetical protein [Campylobacter sp. RM19072]MEE3704814.1 hypothetical protein [Campylobacter sp. CX2-8023-23]MEE3776837.1 hypothetical protein [Campylobacter sp. CX2-4080-23]
MYERYTDIELLKISQNARNYGLEFGENIALLELFFKAKNFEIQGDDLEKIAQIFNSLENIKEKFQLSK